MVRDCRFYIMKDKVTVLGLRDMAETVQDWNLWSACDQHSQPDLLQGSSFSQDS
jgi:hypothetical protein